MISLCAYEDRPLLLASAKILILSLEKHCRDFTLYWGFTEENPEFAEWLGRHAPHVVPVRMRPFAHTCVKHVKPLLFLELFARGVTDATWLDTDIIVLRDLEPLLKPLDEQTILVAEDVIPFIPQRNLRAHYRMKGRRDLPASVDSCILRVTVHHAPLLRKWLEFMNDPYFLEQWRTEIGRRVWGFGLDQTVLQLLLCCGNDTWTPPDPVAFIRMGSEIIQEWGVKLYGFRDRLLNGLGLNRPWAIHIPFEKPWLHPPALRSQRWASVYCAFAEHYRIGVEQDISWAKPISLGSKLARLLSVGQPHWVGWAHCLAAKMFRFFTSLLTARGKDEPRKDNAMTSIEEPSPGSLPAPRYQ